MDPRELRRYGRHLTLPEVGMEGQRRLRAASVLVVGAGGLGSPVALYLAAAGVGRLGLVDFDLVEETNLQRQILFDHGDVGRPKLERARARLEAQNPWVEIVTHDARFGADNAAELVAAHDLVVDGTDNFPTRYLVNDACVLGRRPYVYGSIFRFEGQCSLFAAPGGPCYRCLYPEPPEPGAVPSCAEGGVLGVLPGVVGSLQATEALKWILGAGASLAGRLLLFDALEMRFRELSVRRDPACPVCGDAPTIRDLSETGAACAPAPATEDDPVADDEITVRELKSALDAGDENPLLLDVRTPQEWDIARLPGATLIPVQELAARHGELDRGADIVVYCHTGRRSDMAMRFLRGQGFGKVRNLVGGIEAWAVEVDPTVPRY